MIHVAEVEDKLNAVARNEIGLGDLGDWIESRSWNMHADSSARAIALASEVHRLFSEYDQGNWDESQLLNELIKLRSVVVSRIVVPAPGAVILPSLLATGWSSETRLVPA